MKIMVALANYGLTNRHYLEKMLDEFNTVTNHYLEVYLFVTEPIDKNRWPNLKILTALCQKEMGQMLTHAHMNFFVEKQNDFDYFLYSEDDMMITKENLDLCIQIQETLPMPFVCGFLRYELKPGSDYKYMFDNHPVHSVHRGGNQVIMQNYVINGDDYFEVYNIHQGCYLVPQKALKIAIASGRYLEHEPNYARGVLEGGASNIYWKCGLKKVIPRAKVSELVIAHMPHRYVNWRTEVYNEQSTLSDKTIATHQKEMTPIVI